MTLDAKGPLPLPPKGKKWYIVTGDVTAFYPNVDVKKAKRIVFKLLERWDFDVLFKWYGKSAVGNPMTDQEWDFLDKLWKVANDHLLCRFQNDIYIQLKGLAMGVACSPSIANLYGAYFEERVVPQLLDIWLYCRYIDDIFSLIAAESKEEAVRELQKVRFDNCEITFSAEPAETGVVFLDMEISLDPTTMTVGYRPYRKPQNSFERIPNASHHPLDVKRGTFIGEMSRLAAISSKKYFYEEALQDLRKIYLGRGYPGQQLDMWLRQNATERWRNRHTARNLEQQNVHVIKSVFNPVWGYVPASGLREAIWQYWQQEIVEAHAAATTAVQEKERIRQESILAYFSRRPSMHPMVGGLLPAVEDEDLRRRPATIHHHALRSEGSAALGHVLRRSASPEPAPPSQEASSAPLPLTQELEEGEIFEHHDALLSLLDRRFLVSRKRTRVLGDMVNDWRRIVLAYTPGHDAYPLSEEALAAWTGIGSG